MTELSFPDSAAVLPGDWDAWADDYDIIDVPEQEDTDRAVETLLPLAGPGPVLELMAGTGRIAIPLAQTGLSVTGADISPAMLQRLAAKADGHLVSTRVEALPAVQADRAYHLITILLTSIWALNDRQAQKDTFQNIAAALAPGGYFVLEMAVAQSGTTDQVGPTEFADGSAGHLGRRYETATQRMVLHYMVPTRPNPSRYVDLRVLYPSEAMLMAELAGLVVEHTWRDWDRSPFGEGCTWFIGVFRKPND